MLDLQKALTDAQAVLDQATALEAKVTAIYNEAVSNRDAKRKALTDAATTAYVQGGVDAVADRAQDSAADEVSVESARMLAGSAIDYTHEQLVRAEVKLSAATAVLRTAQRHTFEARFVRDAAQREIDDANASLELARKTAAAPGADVSPTVLGAPTLTMEEIVGWYQTKGVFGYAAGVDLQTLAGYYLFEGAAEGVRGDVAFAQAMVETGAFTSPLTRHNNFAGIGACDSCPTGFDFGSPQLGARAQMQLLHAYADKGLSILDLANPAVGSDPDHLSVRGCCPTWNKLTGTWATDPNYGPKIMTIYLSMLQYAFDHRSTPPPAPPASP
jgi:hypothetical protein